MRFAVFVSLVLFVSSILGLPALAATLGAVSPTGAKEYTLGVGDVIRVEVHDEADLTLETQIPATGMINYPFLGQLRIAGMNVAQLQDLLTDGLKNGYLIKPEVRVRVVQYRPFFVRGEVQRSGGFPYVLGLTVEKATALAGGFTDRASLRNIFLIREGANQADKIKVGLDSPVAPGDTVIVEESLF